MSLFLPDDDDRLCCLNGHDKILGPLGRFTPLWLARLWDLPLRRGFRPLQVASMSWNVGRMSWGMARRANSTEIIGAMPLAKAIKPGAKHLIVLRLGFDHLFEVRRQRRNQPVRKQDPEERADQRGRHLLADLSPEGRRAPPS